MPPISRRLVAAAAVLAVGSLVGHALGIDALTRAAADLPAMSVHTATSVLVLVTALLLPRWRTAGATIGATSGVWAIAVELLDLTFAASWVASPGTGTLILLLAVAMLTPRYAVAASISGVASIGVLIALLMQLRAVFEPAGLVADSGVSVPTALSMSLLSAAWLLRDVDLDDPSVRRLVGWSTRSLIGVVAVLLLGRLFGLDQTPVAATAVLVGALGPVVAAWRAALTERQAIRAVDDVRAVLMHHTNAAVLLVDVDGVVIDASGAAAELLGAEAPAGLVGTSVEAYVPAELRDRHVGHRGRYRAHAEALDMSSRDVLEFVTLQGERRQARIGLARLTDPAGQARFAVTMVDVTALAQQAEQARVQADALRQALRLQTEAADRVRQLDQTKSLLLEAVSHELRTPMAAVLGMSELLAASTGDDPGRDADLSQRLRRQARTLNRRLAALLDLSPAGQLRPPTPTPIDLEDLVRPVVDEIEVEVGRPIAVDVARTRADVDARQFRRLLDGLILNACRHAPNGEIRVVGEAVDGEVVVAVEDEGPGVAPEHRERIFEPFFSDEDSPNPGVGIGLALVRRLADLNGWRCWVEAAPGGGARFAVTLPGATDAGHQAPTQGGGTAGMAGRE